MKDEVKVCLIGSGRAGMIHGHNFAGSVPGGKIIAVCDPVGDVAENAAKELGIDLFYKEYLNVMKNEDIDAVIIACPTKFHKEITVAAANAGKHIFCEKPMAMNEEECDEMIEAAEKNHVEDQVNQKNGCMIFQSVMDHLGKFAVMILIQFDGLVEVKLVVYMQLVEIIEIKKSQKNTQIFMTM